MPRLKLPGKKEHYHRMKYYAVLDTNVLVSAMLKSGSVPDMIAAEAMYGDIIPVLNDEILTEYEDVLRRPKFRFNLLMLFNVSISMLFLYSWSLDLCDISGIPGMAYHAEVLCDIHFPCLQKNREG